MCEDALLQSTFSSILAIDHTRFFRSERGYQGVLYCHLQSQLLGKGLITEEKILEIEYQKTNVHRTHQRPDIIYHIPVEISHSERNVNNFAVWALKLAASPEDAKDDFNKLNQMFKFLNYPLGFFININSKCTMNEYYEGIYPDQLVCFAVQKEDEGISIIGTTIIEGKVTRIF